MALFSASRDTNTHFFPTNSSAAADSPNGLALIYNEHLFIIEARPLGVQKFVNLRDFFTIFISACW